MSAPLATQIDHYQHWRDDLIHAINAYESWMDKSGHFDAQQSLRLYDLLESLKKDRLVLAFVAEFSRGKTELINALFFSDFKQRLLPSDVGRTTMCPTEIFYDPEEAPYIRFLPIETRYRDDSIGALKRMPVEWSKIRLDLASPENMLNAMNALTETKLVFSVEARAMGLWDEDEPGMQGMLKDGNRVEIPAWRYAQINYPHPLLKSGLVILDTPGLNALGTEPELTLSIIPSAHAVLFLLATDTGVTKSDMEIWNRYVDKHISHRLAVLNKIDVLWDELKTEEQIQRSIQRQVESTAKQLGLPASNVLAVSAQKALLAKIRGDAALLDKSGIEKLEYLLAQDIIPTRQAIVRDAVVKEIGGMVELSKKVIRSQLTSARHELTELSSLTGKNREVTKKLREKILADKMIYDESVKKFSLIRQTLTRQGGILMATLSEDKLEEILNENLESIQGSWTTAGLKYGMRSLFGHVMRQFEKTEEPSKHIKRLLEAAYANFHEKHPFVNNTPPLLNLDDHQHKLRELVQKATNFCNDPVNIMTEKRFLIKKFYLALVAQAEEVFDSARADMENWLKIALNPLFAEIKEFKIQLERRLENIRKIHDNIGTLQERINKLQREINDLNAQSLLIDDILSKLQVTHPGELKVATEA